MSQILIATRLSDGLVVYLASDGSWVESIARSSVALNEPDGEQLLQIGKQAEIDCKVIDPYLIEVTETKGVRRPVVFREAIRAGGPTVQTGNG